MSDCQLPFGTSDDIPPSGALLREAGGTIWVVYGGAKFHVPDPAILKRLFGDAFWSEVGNGALESIGAIPSEGTLLGEESGARWVICGGAKFHIPDPETQARVIGDAPCHPLWDGALDGIGTVPADCTLIREENGQRWVVYGGAKFPVPDLETYVRLFGDADCFPLWNGALDGIARFPVDGTLLREENGTVWVIYSGAKFHVPNTSTQARFYGETRVHQLWDGALNHIGAIPADGTLLAEEGSPVVSIVVAGQKKLAPRGVGKLHVLWARALMQVPWSYI